MNWTIIPADEWRKKVRGALMQNASSLIEIDRKIVKAIVESNFEDLSMLISEFRDRKINVRKGLAELGVVEDLDDSEKEVLIRVQKEFATDSVIEQFEGSAGQGASFYELSDKEVDELGQDLFYTWISHYEYIRNIFKLNTLILRTTIPEGLRRYIIEARDCFALQQYNATVSMCRTILEGAVRDLCEKKGFVELHGNNLININPKDVFYQLTKKVSTGKLKRSASKIYYRDASPIIHGDRSIDADEALRVLRETIDIVQELYSLHES